jgi:hypothetical protein
MASAPLPFFCAELHRLKNYYRWAVSEYLRLQSAQTAAVINSDPVNFQRELHEAQMRKDEAKYAVLTHVEEHGCG